MLHEEGETEAAEKRGGNALLGVVLELAKQRSREPTQQVILEKQVQESAGLMYLNITDDEL